MSNNTVKKVVREVYLGHRFTTNDFVSFEYDAVKGLMTINDVYNNIEIKFDMTQHSMEMLYKLFKYVLEDNGDHHGK
jgi:hypothetical protein